MEVFYTSDVSLQPTREKDGVGWDIRSARSMNMFPNQTSLLPTSIRLLMPNGVFATVLSRSGLAAKQNIFVLNSPGLIDTNYTGEIKVILSRLPDVDRGNEPFKINIGDRIAQLVFQPDHEIDLCRVPEEEFCRMVEETTETNLRGSDGFGSTGV